MRTRFRIGPFTFGRTGIRLSLWSKGSGFSLPLFNRKARSFGKIRLGAFSFYFNEKSKKRSPRTRNIKDLKKARTPLRNAYEPWSSKADRQLVEQFRKGKTVEELSKTFGRSKGAIRARINKLLLQ